MPGPLLIALHVCGSPKLMGSCCNQPLVRTEKIETQIEGSTHTVLFCEVDYFIVVSWRDDSVVKNT